MKQANVVYARDLGPLRASETEAPAYDPDRVGRIADLLRRYPAIAEAERLEVLDFLKNGPHLERGLLSSRDGVQPRIIAFRKDHAREFRLGLVPSLLFLVAVLGPLIALAWANLA